MFDIILYKYTDKIILVRLWVQRITQTLQTETPIRKQFFIGKLVRGHNWIITVRGQFGLITYGTKKHDILHGTLLYNL